MIDGYEMWCGTTSKHYFSIREILGLDENNNKIEDLYEDVFNILIKIVKYKYTLYFTFIDMGEDEIYEFDQTHNNISTNFVLKCTSARKDPIKFVKKKKRSRREERDSLSNLLKLWIYVDNADEIEKIKEEE